MSKNIGGQALIEGVMMRSGDWISVSVNKGDTIKTKTYRFVPFEKKHWIFSLPFIRGIFSLLDMLYIGMKEMTWSANEAADEEDEKMKTSDIIISIVLSFLFALLLFKALPLGLTRLMGETINDNRIIFNAIDGLLRISIFIIYIWVISAIPDIRRVFQYHGAEHKVVHANEAGVKLSVANVKKHTTLHKRCGTSFLFITLILAIIIFSLVPIDLPFIWLFLVRIPLVLPIAGISYEILKLNARFPNPITGILIYPGLLLQKITTKEPDDRQIEVAIAALRPLLNK